MDEKRSEPPGGEPDCMSMTAVTTNAAEPDLTLFQRALTGDRSAWKELAARYDKSLADFFRYKAGDPDCEDLKQQVWVALALCRRGIDSIESFRAYTFGIARNLLCDYYRGRNNSPAFDPLISSLEMLDQPLSQQVAEHLGAQHLHLALRRLPLDTQVLLELRYFQEMSTRELAQIYEVPVGTMKRWLFEARKRLEAQMKFA